MIQFSSLLVVENHGWISAGDFSGGASSAAAAAAAQAAAVAARVAAAAAAGGLGLGGLGGGIHNEDIRVPDKMVGLSKLKISYSLQRFSWCWIE